MIFINFKTQGSRLKTQDTSSSPRIFSPVSIKEKIVLWMWILSLYITTHPIYAKIAHFLAFCIHMNEWTRNGRGAGKSRFMCNFVILMIFQNTFYYYNCDSVIPSESTQTISEFEWGSDQSLGQEWQQFHSPSFRSSIQAKPIQSRTWTCIKAISRWKDRLFVFYAKLIQETQIQGITLTHWSIIIMDITHAKLKAPDSRLQVYQQSLI